MVQVIKRDGREVDFETQKIVIAVEKAMKETERELMKLLRRKSERRFMKSIRTATRFRLKKFKT